MNKGMYVRFSLFWEVNGVTYQKSEDVIYTAADD
jgi:hypothetical protein